MRELVAYSVITSETGLRCVVLGGGGDGSDRLSK